ncbi:rhamnogalacturonan acetylesterase [uncultured Draconibacterium sp.]|uniref:rhamnogalacturonan acetylesterase n=1 Tax=uncultured Draconibacterium sp. TaxID=1573823 RepID=UPI003217E0EA
MMKRLLTASLLLLTVLLACETEKKPFSIYAVGDSTMANKKAEVYPETGWCMVLNAFFDESVSVKNHAVNGRSSKSFIDQGRWQTVLDSLQPGDYVFIQFGHNDQKIKSPDRYTEPFGEYTKNLKKYVLETREKGATPILFTSIIRRHFGEDGKLVDTHGDYPVATRQVAEKLDVPLIDLQQITENWVNELGDEASKKMWLWTEPNEKFPEGRQDDTHLRVEGAKEIARLAMENAKEQNLPFAERLN